jgi:hypothetical protein
MLLGLVDQPGEERTNRLYDELHLGVQAMQSDGMSINDLAGLLRHTLCQAPYLSRLSISFSTARTMSTPQPNPFTAAWRALAEALAAAGTPTPSPRPVVPNGTLPEFVSHIMRAYRRGGQSYHAPDKDLEPQVPEDAGTSQCAVALWEFFWQRYRYSESIANDKLAAAASSGSEMQHPAGAPTRGNHSALLYVSTAEDETHHCFSGGKNTVQLGTLTEHRNTDHKHRPVEAGLLSKG